MKLNAKDLTRAKMPESVIEDFVMRHPSGMTITVENLVKLHLNEEQYRVLIPGWWVRRWFRKRIDTILLEDESRPSRDTLQQAQKLEMDALRKRDNQFSSALKRLRSHIREKDGNLEPDDMLEYRKARKESQAEFDDAMGVANAYAEIAKDTEKSDRFSFGRRMAAAFVAALQLSGVRI